MKRYVKVSICFLIVSMALAAGIFIGKKMSPLRYLDNDGDNNRYYALRKLNYALDILNKEYVNDINYDTLVDNTLSTMLYSLDPFSSYVSREALASDQEQMSGQLEGVGILLYRLHDSVFVNNVIEGSPASRVTLQPGDCILKVGDRRVSGVEVPIDTVVKLIKGPRHTNVVLTVKHYNQSKPQQLHLRRAAVPTPSIGCHRMLSDTIGYIVINSFTLTTAEEFHSALSQLREKGMRHLILDLRGNGGGVMDAAVAVVNELLPDGRLIVFTQGAHQRRQEFRSSKGGLFTKGGVTVLINENSASASEIVAGALQDNDRALIVGRRSFGKGLVQVFMPLPDQSAVRLTVARYYTPSGRCIQRSYDKGSDTYMREYIMRLYDFYSDSVTYTPTDTTRYFTSKGRVVYGGGGISPDITLPRFTDEDLLYLNMLQDKGIFREVAMRYVARNWSKLRKQYIGLDHFINHFNAPEALLTQAYRIGDAEGMKRDPECISKYGDYMRQMIKADVAVCLFGSNAYLASLTSSDDELQRALDFIHEGLPLPSKAIPQGVETKDSILKAPKNKISTSRRIK